MTRDSVAVIVLAAGQGTRMKSDYPKVMHRLAGRPMLAHVLESATRLAPDRVVAVIGPNMDDVAAVAAPHPTVVQAERLGTGHAVQQARAELEDFSGDVLIVYGDTPFLTPETMRAMVNKRRAEPGPAVVVLGFTPDDPAEYGRLVAGDDGSLDAIVEFKDASPDERAIRLCNSGVMAVDGKVLFELLDQVDNANAKGEYYLTDIVAAARARGLDCAFVEGAEDELMGINSRRDLARAESIIQDTMREWAMDNGTTLTQPESVFFSIDTRLGRDVVVGPCVVFGPGVVVEDDVEILGFCHFEHCLVKQGARVGPYARLRPGAEIGREAHIGNFVEVKKSVVEDGAKVNHLSYIGDGRVGAGANIGAGTIFCNYDGFTKNTTIVEAGAFIGSNSALVAPVTIGAGAVVGAGSVITKDVSDDALALARGTQIEMPGWAAKFRERKRAEKQEREKNEG